MEKLLNFLKAALLIIGITVLTTIQFQLIDSNGLNVNLSGYLESNNYLSGDLELDNSIDGSIYLSGDVNSSLDGGINTYEQN
tara:strand:- start:228 stop:473 length:246 start_codon:yes stop_codon:yes gene_type:complete